ncbi:MAG TPA: hypothetical protein VLE44_02725 [Candidatus Saccharimonadales bacterium]|nr:hypothetical protein [Candidatus Saccharimonadales bacterium]
MTIRQDKGEIGEKEVCELVGCPNCGKKLIQLPKGFPLYDVQCSGCMFRAQVKTPMNFNGKNVSGAGWNILDKALKVGMIIPPLIVNSKDEVRFYPYIPKTAFKRRIATIKQKNGNEPRLHPMFDYDLEELKYYVLLKK